MDKSALAELYFIAGAMVLIIVLCVGAVFFFVRQFKREKRAHERREGDPAGENTEEG